MILRIFIGYDQREQIAFDVAEKTARYWKHLVIPLYEERLRASGLLYRPTDRRHGIYDLNSDSFAATEFAISRFYVPLLAHSGWALFADSDVVFLEDPLELMAYADESKALYVVKHAAVEQGGGQKMRGQAQQWYPRKLWSSIVLWNCSHIANRRLNLTTLNQWPGRDLHAFRWLADEEIGTLPPEANWLVDLQPKPSRPLIAHFTLGTPDMPGYENSEHADIWWKHARAA